ncbi:MAG: Cytochrome c oxidase assembly protein cox15 [Trichoglossum hirsutum]|nr:MAG: Cytochrome c oxidase assembly protein cox15 [Trichoglossum hirsutum]
MPSLLWSALPVLQRASPRLSSKFFTCRQCLQDAQTRPLRLTVRLSRPARLLGQPTAPGPIRFSSTNAPSLATKGASPLENLGKTIGGTTSRKFFPPTNEKVAAYWLLGSAASVFGIVVFGGLTRLTESGLSITEWRPVTGTLPPMSAADWDSEFTKYRSSPEFKHLNPNMNLDEFKHIYYMEWTHRLWGRVVGLTFALPAIYFVARRKVTASMAAKLAGIAGLIGFQGFLGWWMVKSGLKDDLFAPGSHPRVSQYRLVAHLGTAFLCYTAMLWSGLSILREQRLLRDPTTVLKELDVLSNPHLKLLRRSVGGLTVLVFLTAMSGGLVAGLDAGLIYNEFPYMGVNLTPPKSELFSSFYSRRADGSDIWWRNMLENPSTVQLDHRIMAMTTFTAIMALSAYTRLSPKVRAIMPRSVKKGVTGVVHLAWVQVVLGISTLLYLVPTPLAAAHQAGSLALLTGVMVLGSRLWVPRGPTTMRGMNNIWRQTIKAGPPQKRI